MRFGDSPKFYTSASGNPTQGAVCGANGMLYIEADDELLDAAYAQMLAALGWDAGDVNEQVEQTLWSFLGSLVAHIQPADSGEDVAQKLEARS